MSGVRDYEGLQATDLSSASNGLHLADPVRTSPTAYPTAYPPNCETNHAAQFKHELMSHQLPPLPPRTPKILGLRRTTFFLSLSNILLAITLVVVAVLQSQTLVPKHSQEALALGNNATADNGGSQGGTSQGGTSPNAGAGLTDSSSSASVSASSSSSSSSPLAGQTSPPAGAAATTDTSAKSSDTPSPPAKTDSPSPSPSPPSPSSSSAPAPVATPGNYLGFEPNQAGPPAGSLPGATTPECPADSLSNFLIRSMVDCITLCAYLNAFPSSVTGKCVGVVWVYPGLQGAANNYCYPKNTAGTNRAAAGIETAFLLD